MIRHTDISVKTLRGCKHPWGWLKYQIDSYGKRHADDCHLSRKSTTLGQYSLAFQDPKMWNGIDSKTHNIKSFNMLKNIIKKIYNWQR